MIILGENGKWLDVARTRETASLCFDGRVILATLLLFNAPLFPPRIFHSFSNAITTKRCPLYRLYKRRRLIVYREKCIEWYWVGGEKYLWSLVCEINNLLVESVDGYIKKKKKKWNSCGVESCGPLSSINVGTGETRSETICSFSRVKSNQRQYASIYRDGIQRTVGRQSREGNSVCLVAWAA